MSQPVHLSPLADSLELLMRETSVRESESLGLDTGGGEWDLLTLSLVRDQCNV